MSKRLFVILLSAGAALLALFVTMLLLSLPLGAKGSVLPVLALYVTGMVVAAIFLFAGVFFFLHRGRGLTRKAKRVYDNKIKENKEEATDR